VAALLATVWGGEELECLGTGAGMGLGGD